MQNKARQQAQILSHIAEFDGEEFDFDLVAERFGLNFQQICRHLMQLERDGKIVAHQQFLRKPILITPGDYKNYFWRVYIPSDRHPRSELGILP